MNDFLICEHIILWIILFLVMWIYCIYTCILHLWVGGSWWLIIPEIVIIASLFYWNLFGFPNKRDRLSIHRSHICTSAKSTNSEYSLEKSSLEWRSANKTVAIPLNILNIQLNKSVNSVPCTVYKHITKNRQ